MLNILMMFILPLSRPSVLLLLFRLPQARLSLVGATNLQRVHSSSRLGTAVVTCRRPRSGRANHRDVALGLLHRLPQGFSSIS